MVWGKEGSIKHISLFANKGAHTQTDIIQEEYKHNKTYLQGTGNTSNYSIMCWGRYDTS